MKLNYKKFITPGDMEKPMLVILHGLFGSSDNWRGWAKYLEADFDIFLPDLRNHGKSYTAPGMTYTEQAEDVIELIESNRSKSQKIHLLGHSMGGKTAMMVALLRNDLISSLIVGDIGPKPYPPFHREVINGFKALSEVKISSRKEADKILSTYVPESSLRSFLLKNITREENQYILSPGIAEITKGYEDILKWPEYYNGFAYNGPTLFLKGEKSDYLEKEDISIIKKYFPKAEISVIEQAGHWFHVENPSRLEEELTQFYGKLKP